VRRLAATPVVLCGLGLALLGAPCAQAATSLYPDLETLAPRQLHLDRTDVSVDHSGVMHNVLRFTNTTWNNGLGAAEVRAQIDPATKRGPALERVYDTAGNYADFPVGELYYHPAHNHYHFDNWGAYQLWTRAAYDSWIASGRSLGAAQFIGSKTTSCIMDEEFVRELSASPSSSRYPFVGCGAPNAQGLLVEGLSPGWGDTYDWSRAEQWIDLDQQDLADGSYVLRSVADPDNHVYESPAKADESREGQVDNEAVTAFTVSGGQIMDSNPPDAPTVSVNHVDPETASPNVTVSVLGRDDVSGVDQVRLSNDGNQWKTLTYDAPSASDPVDVPWDLSDPAYGGTQAGGTHTVFAQVHDRSGNWSTSGTDTIVLHNGSVPAYSSAVLADGPAGYWRLGETSGTTAGDSAGPNPGQYRNGATLAAPSLLTSDPGNAAVSLDGVDDHVSVADAPAVSPTDRLSVEAWVKPDALPASGSFASVVTKQNAYSLQFDGSTLEWTLFVGGTPFRTRAPAGAVTAGARHHVVGTYDGTWARLYVDGSEAAVHSLSGAVDSTTHPLTLGAWSATDEFLDGTLDEVAVYGTALPATRVQAHHNAGISAPPDPVTAPSDLAASPSRGRIDLTWTDNAANETGLVLQRDTDPGFATPTEVTLGPNATSYADTNLPDGRRFYYRVSAHNSTDTSGWSNVAAATTPDPVEAPTQLTATAASASRVDLNWLDNATNETSYVVERAASSSFASPTVFTLAANQASYADTTVAASTTYWYRVRAGNASTASAWSNAASATTPAPAGPDQPASPGANAPSEPGTPVPSSPASPAAPVLTPPAGAARIGGSATRTVSRLGRFGAGVIGSCVARPACTLDVRALAPLPGTTPRSSAPAVTLVARTSRRLGAGHAAAVVLRLSARARRVLASRGRLPVRITLTVRAPGRRATTLTRQMILRAPAPSR
jgi:hypothetical protein